MAATIEKCIVTLLCWCVHNQPGLRRYRSRRWSWIKQTCL